MEKRKRTYLKYPFVGVGVVVWKKDKFLLIKRGKQPRIGTWSIPGGRQELGETIVQAAHRETLEETSVKINIIGLVDVVDSIIRDEEGKIQFHATLVDYVAQYVSGTPTPGDDALDCSWFTLGDFPSLQLWNETERIILNSSKMIEQ